MSSSSLRRAWEGRPGVNLARFKIWLHVTWTFYSDRHCRLSWNCGRERWQKVNHVIGNQSRFPITFKPVTNGLTSAVQEVLTNVAVGDMIGCFEAVTASFTSSGWGELELYSNSQYHGSRQVLPVDIDLYCRYRSPAFQEVFISIWFWVQYFLRR